MKPNLKFSTFAMVSALAVGAQAAPSNTQPTAEIDNKNTRIEIAAENRQINIPSAPRVILGIEREQGHQINLASASQAAPAITTLSPVSRTGNKHYSTRARCASNGHDNPRTQGT